MTSTRSSREARKNSEFRRVFFWQLKANRIGAIFYTLGLLVTIPIMHLIVAYSNAEYYLNPANFDEYNTAEAMLNLFSNDMAYDLNSRLTLCLLPLSIVFIVYYCVSAFGFMHGRRSVDLFHSLPVRRIPLLMGSFAAGLVYLYVPIALSLGLCQCISLYYGLVAPYSAAFIWEGSLIGILMITAIYTSSLFFCIVSGTLMDTVISTLALNLGWPLLYYCVYQTIQLTLPGFAYSMDFTYATALSPYLAAFVPFSSNALSLYLDAEMSSFYQISPAFIAWWAALIVVFLLGSIFYYIHRKSECAEDHFSFPLIRGILRFLVSAASGLALGLMLGGLLDSNLIFLIGILVGSAIAHVVSQVIWTHSFRRFWMTVPAYAAMLACIAVFLGVLYTDATGFVTRLPDVSQVEELNFTATDTIDRSKASFLAQTAYMDVTDKNYEYSTNLSPVFTESDDIQVACDFQSTIISHLSGPYTPFNNNSHGYYTDLTYLMKDGSTYRRSYYLPLDPEETADIIAAEVDVVSRDAYMQYSLFPLLTADDMNGVAVDLYSDSSEYSASADGTDELTEKQRKAIWDTFLEELNSPNFEMDIDYLSSDELYDDVAYGDASYAAPESVSGTSPAAPDTLPADRAEAESYFTNTQYYIEFSWLDFEKLPRSYQDLILAVCDENVTPAYVSGGTSTLQIPASCTKTRDLIYKYTRDYGEVYNYVDGEVNSYTYNDGPATSDVLYDD